MENEKKEEGRAYFPLFVDIRGKKILIVGAGTIAARRAEALLGFGPDLTVVAPEISEKILELAKKGCLQVRTRAYKTGDCQGCWMVLAASDDRNLNAQVCKEAKEAGAVVNNASDRTQCDFYFPGLIRRGPAVIGINAGGADHKLAKALRIQIEKGLKSPEL